MTPHAVPARMRKERLEAFSDGVIAVIITIIVLEMKVPHDAELRTLLPLVPVFLTYALTFVYVGIYWNNHHHMMHTVGSINGRVMWANLHLLFWLSMLPFTTGWMGENHFERWPTVLYGVNLLIAALSYTILQTSLIRHEGRDSSLAVAVARDAKGKLSLVLYAAGIVVAWFFTAWAGVVFYVAVALMWLVPDTRLEQAAARPTRSSTG